MLVLTPLFQKKREGMRGGSTWPGNPRVSQPLLLTSCMKMPPSHSYSLSLVQPLEDSWQLLPTFEIHALLDPVAPLLEIHPPHVFTHVYTFAKPLRGNFEIGNWRLVKM